MNHFSAFMGLRRPILDITRERMIPECSDPVTFWEHVHRYAFACRFVAHRRVLDIACGEGYGAAALQKADAARVIGIDVCEMACVQARKKYKLDTIQGTAENIPLANGSVDVVVSFETVEHLPKPAHFLDECARVLEPGGILIISTPNRPVYSRAGSARNPYHYSEMDQREFADALSIRFGDADFYTQRPNSAAWWSARSLISDDSPWIALKGFGRGRRLAQRIFAPEAVLDPTDTERLSVSDLILKVAHRKGQRWNPYAVRPQREWTGENATYFVATAVRDR